MTHQVLTGEEFNEKYKNYNFFKLLTKKLTHYEYTYKDGLNEDINEFNPTGESLEGGLYFTEKNKISMWAFYHYTFITKVMIPNDANVYIGTHEFKSDKLIVDVNNKVEIFNSILWNDKEFCK